MGSILGGCLGSCAATCACKGCEAVCGAAKDSKNTSVMILFIFSILAGILRYYGEPLRDVCGDPTRCGSIGAVYRLMFAVFIFFILHALALTASSCAKKKIHSGNWGIKLFLLAGLLVLSFVLPYHFFDGFRWISLIVAGIFTIIQIILWIAWAYDWNEQWVDKDWKPAIFSCSLVFYLASLTAMVLLFHYFANGPTCGLEKALIGVTIAWTAIFSLISVTEWCEHGALLPSSVCTAYCYWLLYSALSANPDGLCNTFAGTPNNLQTIAGFVMAACSVAYAAFYTSSNAHELSLSDRSAVLLSPGDDEQKPQTEQTGATAEKEPDRKTAIRFQLIMASAACYSCMLLTDWGEASDARSKPGLVSVWVQILAQWMAALLYTWSLIAPYVLTHRQF